MLRKLLQNYYTKGICKMKNNNTKQVVILDNFSSPYICQAILILKDNAFAPEERVIEDAEKIVSEFLNKPSFSIQKKRSKLPFFLLFLGFFCIGAAVLSYII